MSNQALLLYGGLAALLLGCSSDDPSPTTTGTGGQGGGSGAECDGLRAELDAVLSLWFDGDGPGGVAEIRVGDCHWHAAIGLADLATTTPLQPDDLFRVGSITKTFVATVVVMLDDEGLLSLDDPVSDYVTGVPDGDQITVAQLLNHTSGLFDYTFDSTFDWGATYTPAELVALGAANTPYGPPGGDAHYSSTNTIVAGLIIEAVTGEDVAAEIRSRILTPLGLSSTYLDGAEPAVPGLVRGYAGINDFLLGCDDNDVTDALDPSSVWTAGAMVSTTSDLIAFNDGLLSGELVSPAGLDEMQTFVFIEDHPDYGLGLFSWPDRPLGDAVGHPGHVGGYRAIVARYVDSDISLALLFNCSHDWVTPVIPTLEKPIIDRR